MELDAIKLARIVRKCGEGAVVRLRDGGEPLRHAKHGIVVVHPNDSGIKPFEQRMLRHADGRAAVFAHRRGFNAAVECFCDVLHAVADAQYGYAERENPAVAGLRALGIHAVRPAGEDEAGQRFALDLLDRRGVGEKLAVNAGFAHAPGDQLVILPAKIENDNSFHVCVNFLSENE